MEILELRPDQIITLTDYPLHSEKALLRYLRRIKLGIDLPFVPLIRKESVVKYFDAELIRVFKAFEQKNQRAAYFLLDGNHRTTALTLVDFPIIAIVYDNNEDILEARKLVAANKVLKNNILDHTLAQNCEILSKYFSEKPYFLTVRQKTEKMIAENILSKEILDMIKEKNVRSVNENQKT
jgi:hypothetical protein